MIPKTLLMLSCLALAACAPKAAPPVPPSVDFVSATLGQAAEQAHGELAMLARLRGQAKPPAQSRPSACKSATATGKPALPRRKPCPLWCMA